MPASAARTPSPTRPKTPKKSVPDPWQRQLHSLLHPQAAPRHTAFNAGITAAATPTVQLGVELDLQETAPGRTWSQRGLNDPCEGQSAPAISLPARPVKLNRWSDRAWLALAGHTVGIAVKHPVAGLPGIDRRGAVGLGRGAVGVIRGSWRSNNRDGGNWCGSSRDGGRRHGHRGWSGSYWSSCRHRRRGGCGCGRRDNRWLLIGRCELAGAVS